MNVAWENELAELLSNLSAVQGELLELLGKKRELLVKSDIEGLQGVSQREQQLIERLEAWMLFLVGILVLTIRPSGSDLVFHPLLMRLGRGSVWILEVKPDAVDDALSHPCWSVDPRRLHIEAYLPIEYPA